jgi:hypothetical protein
MGELGFLNNMMLIQRRHETHIMGSIMVLLITKFYYANKIDFWWAVHVARTGEERNVKWGDLLENPGVYGRIILKLTWNEVENWLILSCSGKVDVESAINFGNKLPGSIKCGEFLDKLRNYEIIKEHPAAWRYLMYKNSFYTWQIIYCFLDKCVMFFRKAITVFYLFYICALIISVYCIPFSALSH